MLSCLLIVCFHFVDRPLNVEEGVWKKVLRGFERAEDETEELEDEEDEEENEYERELEYEHDGVDGAVEYVSDDDESGSDDGSLGDLEDWLGEDDSASGDTSEADSSSEIATVDRDHELSHSGRHGAELQRRRLGRLAAETAPGEHGRRKENQPRDEVLEDRCGGQEQ